MFATASSDPPVGMTWRETFGDAGATKIHFSGTPSPKLLVGVAWSLVFLGFGYEFLLNVVMAGGETHGSVVAMQAMPIVLIVVGGALAFKWRIGGPSASVLEIGPAAVRISRGFWQNPLVVPPAEIGALVVNDHQQQYEVERGDGYGNVEAGYSETATWYQVTLVTRGGARHVIACFGEKACAVFYAQRAMTLVREVRGGA